MTNVNIGQYNCKTIHAKAAEKQKCLKSIVSFLSNERRTSSISKEGSNTSVFEIKVNDKHSENI